MASLNLNFCLFLSLLHQSLTAPRIMWKGLSFHSFIKLIYISSIQFLQTSVYIEPYGYKWCAGVESRGSRSKKADVTKQNAPGQMNRPGGLSLLRDISIRSFASIIRASAAHSGVSVRSYIPQANQHQPSYVITHPCCHFSIRFASTISAASSVHR